MKEFEKITKKYALNNSYFKNRRPQDPSSPLECVHYAQQHGELPYNSELDGDWIFDCFAEYHKRNTGFKYFEQYFTPKNTARIMAQHLENFAPQTSHCLDACCGFGQLSKAVRETGFIVHGFDIDRELIDIYKETVDGTSTICEFEIWEEKYSAIISNPPYSLPILQRFLNWLHRTLTDDGVAVLLLPLGFFDKARPKALSEVLGKFEIIHREEMRENFATTGMKAEIFVVRKTENIV